MSWFVGDDTQESFLDLYVFGIIFSFEGLEIPTNMNYSGFKISQPYTRHLSGLQGRSRPCSTYRQYLSN